MARATTSLPTPLSPVSRTLASDGAIRATRSRTSRMSVERTMAPSRASTPTDGASISSLPRKELLFTLFILWLPLQLTLLLEPVDGAVHLLALAVEEPGHRCGQAGVG